MANERIEIEIVLDDSQLDKTLENVKKSGKEAGQSLGKNLEKPIKDISKATKNDLISSLDALNKTLSTSTENLAELSTASNTATSSLTGAATDLALTTALIAASVSQSDKIIASVTGALTGGSKNLFRFTTNLAGISAALIVAGEVMGSFRNEVTRTIGSITKITGLILGGFAFAIGLLIIKIGQLAFHIGTKLVAVFVGLSENFIKTDKQLKIFIATINAYNVAVDEGVGSTKKWESLLAELSNTFNFTESSLQKAAAEIIQVGASLHLTSQQMMELTRVSAEYAKVNRKDVFAVSVSLSSALNGNSQAVQALGIKLNEASNQSFLYKKGIDKTFKSLTDSSKAQVRYNNLLKQYSIISGIGAIAASTLADQTNRQKVLQERLNKSIGSGVAILEENNILISVYNVALDSISTSALKLGGFLGALGSRVLQVGGLVLEFSFKIFAVVKGIKLLNLLLASNLAASTFAKSIPLINVSLTALMSNLAGAPVALTSLTSIFSASGLIIRKQFLSTIATLVPKLLGLTRVLLSFAAPAAAIVLPLILIGKAFVEIEKRTGIFKDIFSSLMIDVSAAVDGPLRALRDGFSAIGSVIGAATQVIIGGFVFAINGLILIVSELVQANPFGIFGDQTVAAFGRASEKILKINEELLATNFMLSSMGDVVIASTDKAISGLDKLETKLVKLRKFDIGAAIGNSLGNGIQQAIGAMQKGENAFDAFGKATLSVFGDLAIQLGQFFILTSASMLSLKALDPSGGIVGGLALIALGTLLKGVGGTASAPTSSGADNPTADDFLQDPADLATAQKATEVNIDITGQVVDPRGTALQIAELLRDIGDSNGAILVNA